MTKQHDEKVDSVMWTIVGTTTTILGMSLGAMVLMKSGAIDPVLGTLFVIMTFATLVVVEGVLVWRFLNLSKRAADADDWDDEEDSAPIGLDAPRTRALHEPADRAPGASQVRETFQPVSKEGEPR